MLEIRDIRKTFNPGTVNEKVALKGVCLKYIEWMLASQREDGWFGPESSDDHWPRMVALKALMQYFTAANDKRVLVLMDKFFKYQYHNLEKHPISLFPLFPFYSFLSFH